MGQMAGIVFIIKVHKYVPTIPNAIVALRHLSSEVGDLKVDWMKCLVSTDCEACMIHANRMFVFS